MQRPLSTAGAPEDDTIFTGRQIPLVVCVIEICTTVSLWRSFDQAKSKKNEQK